jgi:hypothetical protein
MGLQMRIEVITHPSGDQLPMLVDDNELPIPTPNELIMGRRFLSQLQQAVSSFSYSTFFPVRESFKPVIQTFEAAVIYKF